ncbi:tRNA-specific 2-thiouridylase MnmA [hydrothermal vent metagenome]|uniref:tRNA-specific 2-thiouridylase MnmA n=1 Tax=hydrothermal vent metagenome TaxID=652676 RepID=A0A3B1A809_9ZZZZ
MNNPQKSLNIIVGISGGVDSSVAAYQLQQQSYCVAGVFMKNWEEDDTNDNCTAAEDFSDAQKVCETLNIPIHGVNFSTEYWDNVFSHFLKEYQAGRTPNPDILCNTEIKFSAFLDYAISKGADKIATGHYARIKYENAYYRLYKSFDKNKDQSYFLHELNQHQLAHSIFPLGELEKNTVRKIAEQQKLITFNKKDSTGICFIGERNFKTFLSTYLPAQPGDIITEHGQKIATHSGLMYYTLGQRQGLGIGGLRYYSDEPWYVAQKNMSTNELVVVQGHEHPLLKSTWLETQNVHWITEQPKSFPYKCTAKTRYRQDDAVCEIHELATDKYRVKFEQQQWAVTPGQSVVFYQGDECLGGAIITEIPNSIK